MLSLSTEHCIRRNGHSSEMNDDNHRHLHIAIFVTFFTFANIVTVSNEMTATCGAVGEGMSESVRDPLLYYLIGSESMIDPNR
jgi:hypothetical protein